MFGMGFGHTINYVERRTHARMCTLLNSRIQLQPHVCLMLPSTDHHPFIHKYSYIIEDLISSWFTIYFLISSTNFATVPDEEYMA